MRNHPWKYHSYVDEYISRVSLDVLFIGQSFRDFFVTEIWRYDRVKLGVSRDLVALHLTSTSQKTNFPLEYHLQTITNQFLHINYPIYINYNTHSHTTFLL